MTNFTDGEYQTDSVETILDAMVADANEYWEEDLKDDDLAVLRIFYRPIAEFLASVQDDLAAVLSATQIDNAEGANLDLLTALIGVQRDGAKPATGQVTFSRDDTAGQDYVIPSGTIVQTDSNDPEKYETTEQVTLASGTSSIAADVEAIEPGAGGNSAIDTLTVMPSAPVGVDSVTNNSKITDGENEETDDELRSRAKEELAKGARASAPALINTLKSIEQVTSVSIFINDSGTDNTGSGGLPDHSFETVVSGGTDADIAQKLLETKAAGDTSYAGANGTSTTATADLPNGQTHDISFSRPSTVKLYLDVDIDVNDDYVGDDEVEANIIDYVGGILPSGQEEPGELGVGDDVIRGEIEYAIRDAEGVYDVTNLEVDTSSSPTGTSNISMAASDIAEADATDGTVDVTSNLI